MHRKRQYIYLIIKKFLKVLQNKDLIFHYLIRMKRNVCLGITVLWHSEKNVISIEIRIL